LLRAEKLAKKARKAGLLPVAGQRKQITRTEVARQLFELAARAQARGWSAEALLRDESHKRERAWRRIERSRSRLLPET
jgi:hypothetical protein